MNASLGCSDDRSPTLSLMSGRARATTPRGAMTALDLGQVGLRQKRDLSVHVLARLMTKRL
jgi:hypothetical protein